ncbi:MAG: hypothetical protein RR198_04925 [Oscillospiraceae bacterium]
MAILVIEIATVAVRGRNWLCGVEIDVRDRKWLCGATIVDKPKKISKKIAKA